MCSVDGGAGTRGPADRTLGATVGPSCQVETAGARGGLRLGLPTLFVPNTRTNLDDQETRVEHAVRAGWALGATDLAAAPTQSLLADLLDRGPAMAATARAADPGNGAPAAADAIRELVSLPSTGAVR